jgi:putative transposase
MPRARRVLQPTFPYHVTLRSINRIHFEIEPQLLWSFACDLLLFCTYAFKIEIHSFVLMSNHYHMIIRTPESNLDKFMNYFNRELSREISSKSGRINQNFGSRYHASVIGNLAYYGHAYKYVYRNPVQSQMCERVQDYTLSSLSFITGLQSYKFPIFDTYFEHLSDYDLNLAWLNQNYSPEHYYKIERALIYPDFLPCI